MLHIWKAVAKGGDKGKKESRVLVSFSPREFKAVLQCSQKWLKLTDVLEVSLSSFYLLNHMSELGTNDSKFDERFSESFALVSPFEALFDDHTRSSDGSTAHDPTFVAAEGKNIRISD